MIASLRRLSVATLLVAAVAALYFVPLAELVAAVAGWISTHPIAGPLAYIGFVALATVLFLPGSIAMMIGGLLFGFLPGVAIAAIAIPVGAQCAFEFGRWFARPWVRAKVASNRRMLAVEAALREQAFTIIVLTRLSLIIPFNVLNYAYGATSVGAPIHFLATAAGMLPAVALYVYLGTLARDLSQILAGEAVPSAMGYWLLAAGIIAIVIATWVIHRAATRALEKQLSMNESKGDQV